MWVAWRPSTALETVERRRGLVEAYLDKNSLPWERLISTTASPANVSTTCTASRGMMDFPPQQNPPRHQGPKELLVDKLFESRAIPA